MTKLRKRHRLKRKDIESYSATLGETFGCQVFDTGDDVDVATTGDMDMIIVGEETVAMILDDVLALTVKGMITYGPTRGYVEVDMGAVPHVINGADIMAPGIVDADPGISSGDLVWIRDQRNRRPLALGRALVEGPEMVSSNRGKAVESLHHYGDEIWDLEP